MRTNYAIATISCSHHRRRFGNVVWVRFKSALQEKSMGRMTLDPVAIEEKRL